jgi:NADH dehydrogenase [ubiquinone] 1 alpha subcomplex assembly factor 7
MLLMAQEQYSPLESIIRERIASRGALTVAEFMELVLGHETYGYYMTRDPFGEHGDFTTAPEISQIFGEMVGTWLAAMWQMLGQQEMVLVELGPGRGTLMADALRATRHVAGFHEALVIVMVESSLMLRRYQRAMVGTHHPRMSWQQNIEELPELPMLLIANEFFDALPIRQYVKTPQGLCERVVTIDEATGALVFKVQPMGITLVKGGNHFAPDATSDGIIIESSPVSRQIASQLAQHMHSHGGAGLIIDYGYSGESRGNTLQSVKQHGFWPPLQAVGEADITAHVAFDDLAAAFSEHHIHTQIGAGMRLNYLLEKADSAQRTKLLSGYTRLTDAAQMGELFKVLGVCSDPELVMAGFETMSLDD